MENIKISVIVPVYNVEKYIRQCLESIVNQTYSNLEIIVVNDGSSDNSSKIINEYVKDKRIKIINTENKGVSFARNLAIKNSTGEYISFVDSDDYIKLDAYETLIKKLQDEDILIFNYGRFENSTGELIKENYVSNDEMQESPKEYSYLYAKINHSCWNKLYKADYLKKYNFKFLEILYEDVFFNLEVIYSTNNIKIINETLYYYRVNRKDSIMGSRKNNNQDYIQRQKLAYKINFENISGMIKKNKENYSAGKMVYILAERENWRAKLEGELKFEEIDNYLKEYLLKEKKNEIANKILIKKLNETLKSKNVIKISGLNLFDKLYWRNGVINFNLIRNRIISNIITSLQEG